MVFITDAVGFFNKNVWNHCHRTPMENRTGVRASVMDYSYFIDGFYAFITF